MDPNVEGPAPLVFRYEISDLFSKIAEFNNVHA